MRVTLILGLSLAALAVGTPVCAQPKDDKEKPAAKPTSGEIHANLQQEIDTKVLMEPLRLKQLLEFIHDKLASKRNVSFVVDEDGFRNENPDLDLYEIEIRFKMLPRKATIEHVLRQALKQLPAAALLVRAGKVEIIPAKYATKEWMLNQTIQADFSERRLDQALEELSELTGVTIVMDGRAKQKAQTAVSARFRGDVALQDAVRMLTDMADLKMVYLVTGIYITTPDHAVAMQKELKKTYGEQEIPAGIMPAGLGGMVGMLGGGPPPDPSLAPGGSIFTPPLPPERTKRVEGAGAFRWGARPKLATVVQMSVPAPVFIEAPRLSALKPRIVEALGAA